MMASATIGAVLDAQTVDSGSSTRDTVHAIQINQGIIAIVYEGPGNDGWLKTYNINLDGSIDNTAVGSLEFDSGNCKDPFIFSLATDKYAIAYQGVDQDGWLVSVQIEDDGTIGSAIIASLEFDTGGCTTPWVVPLGTQTYYAIVYGFVSGFLKTVQINDDGTMGTVQDTWNFDAADGDFPQIINISGTTYAIRYSNTDNDLALITLTIGNTGTITKSTLDSKVIASTSVGFPISLAHASQFIQVSGVNYALCYFDKEAAQYVIETWSIASNGTIGASAIDTETIASTVSGAEGPGISIVKIDNDTFWVAYSHTNGDGFTAVYEIATNGAINSTLLDGPFEFETSSLFLQAHLLDVGSSGSLKIIVHGKSVATGSHFESLGIVTETIPGAWLVATFPSEAITRVTNLIHRYVREGGVYTLEMSLGEVTSDFGLPQWLSAPQPAVAKTEADEFKSVQEAIDSALENERTKIPLPLPRDTDLPPIEKPGQVPKLEPKESLTGLARPFPELPPIEKPGQVAKDVEEPGKVPRLTDEPVITKPGRIRKGTSGKASKRR